MVVTQVIRVVNALLRTDAPSLRLGLRMRHYSVTPFGDRVGLIQWVGGTVSLFALFKGWQRSQQERHAAVVAARQAESSGAPRNGQPGLSISGCRVAKGTERVGKHCILNVVRIWQADSGLFGAQLRKSAS